MRIRALAVIPILVSLLAAPSAGAPSDAAARDVVLDSEANGGAHPVSLANVDGMDEVSEGDLGAVVLPNGYGEGASGSRSEVLAEQDALLPGDRSSGAQVEDGQPSGAQAADAEGMNAPAESLALRAEAALDGGVSVSGIVLDGAHEDSVSVSYRALVNGEWSNWTDASFDGVEALEGGRIATDPIVLVDATRIEAIVRSEEWVTTSKIDAKLSVVASAPSEIDSGAQSPRSGAASTQSPVSHEGAFVAVPASNLSSSGYDTGFFGLKILTREQWGAPTSSEWALDPITPVGVVVHHTASTNTYTQANAAQIVKGIYTYHAVSLDWGDIGYHFLVDRFGTIYEGRLDSLETFSEAGHAYGANQNTVGVSVVGNFTDTQPPIVAQNSVAKVSAWLLSRMGVADPNATITVKGSDLQGRRIQALSGHRDVGGTECPGEAFYAKLPRLRTVVALLLKGRNAWIDSSGAVQSTGIVAATRRLSGSDRAETAIAISREQFPNGASTVYLVNSTAMIDALTAGTVKDGPILLANKDSIPAATRAEISRLKATKVVLVGGSGVLSNSLWVGLPAVAHLRLGGADRFETARTVARYVFPTGSAAVYVADGFGPDLQGSPDAIVGANSEDGPILLARLRSGFDRTTESLARNLGGTLYQLGSPDLGIGATVIGGADRYATSIASAKRAFPKGANTVYLVRGDVFADGVAGGTLTAGPRLLTASTALPASVCAYLSSVKPRQVVAIGGTAAVSDSVLDTAASCAAR